MVGLLQHLKSHRRISPPTDLESSYLLENGLEPTALANTRLPFHLLFQTNHAFWKIVCVYQCVDFWQPCLLYHCLPDLPYCVFNLSLITHLFSVSSFYCVPCQQLLNLVRTLYPRCSSSVNC